MTNLKITHKHAMSKDSFKTIADNLDLDLVMTSEYDLHHCGTQLARRSKEKNQLSTCEHNTQKHSLLSKFTVESEKKALCMTSAL